MEAAVHKQPQSRLGKRPVVIPKGVSVNLTGQKVDVQGPKGKLTRVFPGGIVFTKDGDAVKVVSDAAADQMARLQGLGRALLASMVKGCAEGYERVLELHGTGYRAELKGTTLTLQLGFSHPCPFDLPAGLTATIPGDSKGTVVILNCADKELLGQVAAQLRSLRPPEPYGGKGVRYRGEVIRRKAGKSGKKK